MREKQLVYLSRATSYVDQPELCSIAEDSAKRNRAVNVTGALIFCNGYFLQVLEGPDEMVEALYAKIAKDSRHCDVMLIRESSAFERLFPDWNMASLHEEHMRSDLVKRVVEYVAIVGKAADATLTAEARDLLADIQATLATETGSRVKKVA